MGYKYRGREIMEEAIRPLVESLSVQFSPPYIYEGLWEEERMPFKVTPKNERAKDAAAAAEKWINEMEARRMKRAANQFAEMVDASPEDRAHIFKAFGVTDEDSSGGREV